MKRNIFLVVLFLLIEKSACNSLEFNSTNRLNNANQTCMNSNCNITCESFSCSYSQISCLPNTNCLLNCLDDISCYSLIIDVYNNSNLNINCQHDSCQNIQINTMNSPNNININCLSDGSCDEIYLNSITNSNANINNFILQCYTNDACDDITINGQINNFNINCITSYSCSHINGIINNNNNFLGMRICVTCYIITLSN